MHVINSLDGGGAEKLVYEFSLFQHAKSHNVTVVTLFVSGKDVYSQKLMEAGINVMCLKVNKYSIRAITCLRKLVKKVKPQIVHSHLFPSQYYVVLATLGLHIKLVTTEHSTSNSRIKNHKLRFVENFIYSRYDKIVTIGDGVQDVYTSYLPKLKNHIVKIQNGINLTQFSDNLADKKYLGFNYDVSIVTMVARFSEEKDQNTVIRAISLLPQNVHLLLVGSGEDIEEYHNLVANLHLESRVHFLGFRTDINKILSLSDLVVLSSFWEGFGLSILEGMASRKPVIATNVTGLKDIVADAGELFDVGGYEQLAKIISSLLNNREYYNLCANKCFLRAQEYNIVITNENYLDLYQSII